MSNFLQSAYTALNNLVNISADYIYSYNLEVINSAVMKSATIGSLTITNAISFPFNFIWSSLIQQDITLTGTNQLVKTNFTNNITQSSGSATLLDTNIGSISQSDTSVIVQSGTQWNQLKKTQITDLSVTGTLTLPSDIVINGSTYNNDLILNNATIQQTVNNSDINTLCATDFYNGDVRLNNNLTMIGGASTTATLKNLVVQGNSSMGIITGTTITDLQNQIDNIVSDAVADNNTWTGTNTFNNTVNFNGTVNGLTKSTVGLTNIDNTSDLNKPISTATQTALNLKANITNPTFLGTVTSPNLILPSGNVQTTLDSLQTGLNLKANITSPTFLGTVTSPNLILPSGNVQTTLDGLQTGLNLKANITSPTFLGTVTSPNLILPSGNVQTTLDSLQTQVTNIVNTPNVKSIAVGTVSSIASDQQPYITNTGTATNQILNFFIPKGTDGANGAKGEKGDRGSKGEQGDTGPQGGDGGGAVAGAAAGGAAGAVAGTAAGSAVASTIATSVATGICAAQLALIEPQITALETTAAGLQTQIDTLGEGMTQIDSDIIQLKGKTQYQNVVGSTTVISSALETGNIISSGTLYVASDSTIVGTCKASHFSGGILPTRIDGPIINIGTNEVLFNNVNIGSATTITTINGIVNFSNPFNNFFSQF